eukprot:1315043-Amorphochlora_amoeboformis.AAC.3
MERSPSPLPWEKLSYLLTEKFSLSSLQANEIRGLIEVGERAWGGGSGGLGREGFGYVMRLVSLAQNGAKLSLKLAAEWPGLALPIAKIPTSTPPSKHTISPSATPSDKHPYSLTPSFVEKNSENLMLSHPPTPAKGYLFGIGVNHKDSSVKGSTEIKGGPRRRDGDVGDGGGENPFSGEARLRRVQ